MITSQQQEKETEDLIGDCIFCKKGLSPIRNRIVYEDDSFLAFHHFSDGERSYLGLVLIQSKRHIHDLGELSDPEAERLGLVVQRISRALKLVTGASWTYSYCFMEGVRHVHTFVASRYPNLPKEYVRLDIGNWPEAPLGTIGEVEDLSRRLRKAISG